MITRPVGPPTDPGPAAGRDRLGKIIRGTAAAAVVLGCLLAGCTADDGASPPAGAATGPTGSSTAAGPAQQPTPSASATASSPPATSAPPAATTSPPATTSSTAPPRATRNPGTKAPSTAEPRDKDSGKGDPGERDPGKGSTTSAPPPATTPVPPPSTDGGGIRKRVDPKPVTSRPPVALDRTARVEDDLTVRIEKTRAIDAEAKLPGEIAGPGVVFELVAENRTGQPVDLGAVVVECTDASGAPCGRISTEPADPFTGTLEPGDTARGSYVFVIDKAERKNVTVIVTLTGDRPVVRFEGPVG